MMIKSLNQADVIEKYLSTLKVEHDEAQYVETKKKVIALVIKILNEQKNITYSFKPFHEKDSEAYLNMAKEILQDKFKVTLSINLESSFTGGWSGIYVYNSCTVNIQKISEPKFLEIFSSTKDFEDMACMQGLFPDFSIKFEKRVIGVHRAVLYLRVPYFKSLLNSSMDETLSQTYNLKFDQYPIKEEILDEIISYVYSGTINLDNKASDEVLSVALLANYFLLDKLVERCSFALYRMITPNNREDLLACAAHFNLTRMLELFSG